MLRFGQDTKFLADANDFSGLDGLDATAVAACYGEPLPILVPGGVRESGDG